MGYMQGTANVSCYISMVKSLSLEFMVGFAWHMPMRRVLTCFWERGRFFFLAWMIKY